MEHPHPEIYFVLILSSIQVRTPSLQQVPSVVLLRTVSSSSQRRRIGLQRPTLRKLDTSATSGDFFARSRRDIRDVPILVTLSEGFVLQEQLFRAFVTLATLGSGRLRRLPRRSSRLCRCSVQPVRNHLVQGWGVLGRFDLILRRHRASEASRASRSREAPFFSQCGRH